MDKVKLSFMVATVVVLFSYSAYLSHQIRKARHIRINSKEKEN